VRRVLCMSPFLSFFLFFNSFSFFNLLELDLTCLGRSGRQVPDRLRTLASRAERGARCLAPKPRHPPRRGERSGGEASERDTRDQRVSIPRQSWACCLLLFFFSVDYDRPVREPGDRKGLLARSKLAGERDHGGRTPGAIGSWKETKAATRAKTQAR
jgi:hypothetical protein